MRVVAWKRTSIGALALVIVLVCGLVATAIAGLTPEQARELGEIQRAIKAKGPYGRLVKHRFWSFLAKREGGYAVSRLPRDRAWAA